MTEEGDHGSDAAVDDLVVEVFGDFVKEIIEVPFTSQMPLFSVGRHLGKPVLVPFVELKVKMKGSDGEPLPDFVAKIYYENLAYILCDMAGDFERVTEQLAQVSGSGLTPVAERMLQVVEYLELAQQRAAAAAAHVRATYLDKPSRTAQSGRKPSMRRSRK